MWNIILMHAHYIIFIIVLWQHYSQQFAEQCHIRLLSCWTLGAEIPPDIPDFGKHNFAARVFERELMKFQFHIFGQ